MGACGGLGVGTTDGRQMYLVGRFVSRKTSAERRKEKAKAKAAAAPFTPSPRAVPFLNFPAPAVKKDLGDLKDLSASFTTAADDSDALSVASSASTVELALDEAAALLPSALTAERTTHAVGIARYAFKHAASASRRSIPPALVLATCGFSASPPPLSAVADRRCSRCGGVGAHAAHAVRRRAGRRARVLGGRMGGGPRWRAVVGARGGCVGGGAQGGHGGARAALGALGV